MPWTRSALLRWESSPSPSGASPRGRGASARLDGHTVSRPEARCRLAAGPFPQAARRTRRACLHATGSPWSLPWACSRSLCPGVGDLVSSVAIPPDRYRFGVEQFDPVRADRFPPAGVVGEPATDVLPPPAMPGPHHPHDPPPGVALELAEGALCDGVLEVVGPAARDLVDPDQHGPEVLL